MISIHKNTVTFVLAAALLGVLLLAVYVLGSFTQKANAAAGQLAGTVATSSRATVTSTAAVVFATSTNCAAREIGTASSSITVSFTDKDTPTASFGFPQAASTTVIYDASQYGCGQVKVFSATTQQITVQEVQ